MMTQRHGDMSRDVYLRLRSDRDGDILVTVDGFDGMTCRPSVVTVEFCKPGLGGGRSPRTFEALCRLMEVMAQENAESPFTPTNAPGSAA